MVTYQDPNVPPEEEEWSEDEENTGRLLNDEISKRLEVQRQAGSTVETKAGLVAAAGLTATQFIAAQKNLNTPLLIATFSALAATVVLAYESLRIRQFGEVPEPREAYRRYYEAPAAKLLFDLAYDKVLAFEGNRVLYKRKARLQRWSLWALAAAALLGVLARLVGS